VRRALLGWFLVALGGVTMTLAVAGCVWVYLRVSSVQFDRTPAWIAGGLVLAIGGAMLGAGVWTLLAKR
jgi:hypothetical protein